MLSKNSGIMEKNVILYIIVGMITIFILISFVTTQSETFFANEKFRPPSKLTLNSILPVITPSATKDFTGSYQVELFATVEYTGEWKLGEREINSVDIIPLIEFKGSDKKAKADGSTYFTLTKSDDTFSGTFSAELESNIAPTKVVKNVYEGEMLKGESVLIETETGNFLVTLDDLVKVYTHEPLPGTFIYSSKLSVECQSDYKNFVLADWRRCEKDDGIYSGRYEKCEKYLDMCGGELYIRVDGPTAFYPPSGPYKTSKIFIEASGGKPYDYLGEVVISFWRDSNCVAEYDTYDDLIVNCGDDYIGYGSSKYR